MAVVFGTVKVWWWQIICQKALQLQAHIMVMNYINYAKHWKTSVEESRDMDFICCLITRLPWTFAVATSAAAECGYELLLHPPHSPDLALSDFCLFPLLKRLQWHTFFEWQWRHCVCGGLSSGARYSSTRLVYKSCRNDGTSALKLAEIVWKKKTSHFCSVVFLYIRGRKLLEQPSYMHCYSLANNSSIGTSRATRLHEISTKVTTTKQHST